MKKLSNVIMIAIVATAASIGSTAFAEPGPLPTVESCCEPAIAVAATAASVNSSAVVQRGSVPVRGVCCDPALATMSMSAMFSEDLAPAGSLTSNYGLLFNPTAAFNTALDNTAFMAAVMGGIPTVPGTMAWLVVEAEMRTTNLPNATWPIVNSPTYGSPIAGQFGNILAWNQVPPNTVTPSLDPHNRAWVNALLPAQMRTDGTIYQVRLTYWMYRFINGRWYRRPVVCSNARDRYVTIQKNQSQRGAAPQLEIASGEAPLNEADARMRMGDIALSPAEVSALPAELVASIR